MLPALESERDFYVYRVVDALITAHAHAPTADNPEGALTDDESIAIGLNLLYKPPSPPADPADDHAVMMAWLQAMIA